MKFARPVRSMSPGGTDAPFARISNGARGLLIFSYGLFTIAAQTLLFREFITTFEGNDISVGLFFASWFLWVGLGAILVYRAKSLAEKLLQNIEILFLVYLPAFVLELILIIQARELAGVESYALLPIRTILLLSIVVNAPVSIITGIFFPLACRWIQSASRPSQIANRKQQIPTSDRRPRPSEGRGDKRFARGPVSRVYIIEAVGSFVGGLGVTVLLGLGVSLAKIFFILAFIVSLSVFCVQLARGLTQYGSRVPGRGPRKVTFVLSFLLTLSVCLCVALEADKTLMRYVRVVKWTKLLPADALTGSFQTAQAEYLYGVYQGQWIAVREGSTCEALPDHESAGRIAAIGLCQNPDAKRVLVIGSGLGLCYEFLRLPQLEHISWAHCDSEYIQKVDKFIPQRFKVRDERFHPLAGDVRLLLAGQKQYYDLVVLNLPDATSSVLNRYYTVEFYRRIKESLRADGVLTVRVAGGENIMGTELINLGASTKLTLQKVFSQLVLTPGVDTWFIVSDSEELTGEPGTLRDRFAAIKGGSNIFPPQALLSVYLPDRAAAALENYSAADLPEELLINRDSRPLTHLYSLLLAAKQSQAPVAKFVKLLALAGPLAFLVPVLVFVVLRIVYILKTTQQGPAAFLRKQEAGSSFDSTFLVFSAGSVGIGIVIVLMYLYQTRFGSLYLHIGVISSVFMVGLTIGASLISSLVARRPSPGSRVTGHIFAVVLVHTVILSAIALWPGEQWTHLIFAIAFVLCGLCAGCYFPLAARQLADSGFETGQAGSKLEMADHLGASAGGLLTGLALVPVLGTKQALFVFILLILANVPAAALRICKQKKVFSSAPAGFNLRGLGYILFGIGVSIVLCSNLLTAAGAALRPSLPRYAAQALAGGELRLVEASAELSNDARKLNYFTVCDPNEKLTGYIFSSQELAPEVRGFGGKMNLAIYVDTAGKLIDFHIIRSNETPSYLELLSQWRDSLNGHQLFQPRPFADVHAVTGATVSCEAIVSALASSGRRFATQILGQAVQPDIEPPVLAFARKHGGPDTHGIYLISAFVLTLIVIYHGGFWSRLAILCFNLVAGGIVLNAQYSSEQIATILSLHAPAVGLSGAFLLAIGIPLLVVIFGNFYCGYICPFGAAQELLGYITGARLKQPVPAESNRYARFVKYVVLFVLIIVFFSSRDRTTLAADPLIEIFHFRFSIYNFQSSIVNWQSSMLLIAAVALVGSILYTRFWCRYLCPVGAFLSLFNNIAILKRYLPAKKFGRCEFGLRAHDKMDCLYCDKCRYDTKRGPAVLLRKSEVAAGQYLVVGVLVIAILLSTVSVNRFLQVIGSRIDYPSILVSSGGEPRDVDLQRIRTMIRQKRLSDQEAQFYKKVE